MHATPAINADRPAPCRGSLSGYVKRAFDVGFGVFLLLVASPLLLAAAIAVKLDSPGPVIFRQQRVGQGGRPFVIWKFRTMVHHPGDGNRSERETAITNERASKIDLETYVFQNAADPRITRVGRWLRRTSVDELPQLWNVIRGEMSLVGPRPEVPEVVALYNDTQRRRLSVKPGMTGLAQVAGRGTLTVAESIRYDLQYVDCWSLWLDLWIVLRTVGVVICGAGAR